MVDILEKYLIIETVEQQLKDAIDNHQVLTMHYKGYRNVNPTTGRKNDKDRTIPGVRHILPVALGVHKDSGAEVVRALVVSRGVHTPERYRPTKWRMFRVDRISRLEPREGQYMNPEDLPPEFNPQGDNSMSVVYAHASTGQEKEPVNVPVTPQAATAPPEAPPIAPPTAAPAKLDKVPDNTKVVLKAPEKEKPAPKKAKPTTAKQPTPPPPVPEPVEPEQPVVPEPKQPEEPEDITQPIKEMMHRLNKLIK